MTDPQTTDTLQALLPHFRENGYVILKDTLTADEVTYFREIYDRDREKFGSPKLLAPFLQPDAKLQCVSHLAGV